MGGTGHLPLVDFRKPLFDPGSCVTTPAAVDAIESAGMDATEILDRHVTGDWGDQCKDDCQTLKNERFGFCPSIQVDASPRIRMKKTSTSGRPIGPILPWEHAANTAAFEAFTYQRDCGFPGRGRHQSQPKNWQSIDGPWSTGGSRNSR